MRKLIVAFIAVSILFTLGSCRKEGAKIGNRLEGEWNVKTYIVSEIYSDGTEKVTQEYSDAGNWSFELTDDDPDLDYILQYEFDFTAGPTPASEKGTIFISEEGYRMIFIKYWCNREIGCDMMYNIKEWSRNRMVLEQFNPQNFKPQDPPRNLRNLVPDQDPNSEAVVYKLKMVIER